VNLRDFLQSLRRRADIGIASGVFLAVALAAATVPAWNGLERRFFDLLTVTTAPGKLTQPIVLVAINEEAFEAMKRQWPWPRGLHAQLIDRLTKGGAIAIGVDLFLPDPSTPAEDAALATAIAAAGNMVLASDLTQTETAVARLWKRTDPLPAFKEAGALAGVATVTFDPDHFVRMVPSEPDAFWRQIVKIVQIREPTLPVPPLPEKGAMIRYLGPDTVFDPIPYHLVLEASPEELKSAFAGRIVIVGFDLRAAPELGLAQTDLFATPFLTYSGGLLAGMKVHATLVDNALNGATLRSLGLAGNIALEALAAILSFFAFRRWRPILGGLLLVAIGAAFAALAWYLFVQGTWMALAAPLTIAAASYLAYGVRSYFAENRRKREIQQAFSRYVSPQVVDQIVSNPERLALGGEYREITVMFTDLKGFTKLSEQSKPEIVSQILIRHFSAMTDVILRKEGTVVQFIGDAIMAFWGAPLDDADHALHAVEAGIEMQEAMKKLRTELAAEGLPELYMRVGINTCRAIVGNMGSATRFAYTAQGDGINLASRLEGANKAYGTAILASGETVAQLRGRVPMRRVDRVKVSGKSEAVDIFTPATDPALVAATATAFEAYLRRDWAEAAALYGRMREEDPEDPVAASLSERIEAGGKTLVEVGEDGSISLDKL